MSTITFVPIIFPALQVIAAFLLFMAGFVVLFLSAVACFLFGWLLYVGANWVWTQASRWDHSALDRYVSVHANAIGRPLFAWWARLHFKH